MNNLKEILEAVAVPVVAVDANLSLVAANGPARQAFSGIDSPDGFTRFLANAAKLHDLLDQALLADVATKARIKFAKHSDYNSDYHGDYNVKINRIGWGTERATLVLTFEDRSRQENLKTMRTSFVANVSHEIRSPLTAISGFVETLQGPAIEDIELRGRFLGMMAKEVARMTNLVSDLLSLSQVEAKERNVLKKEVLPNQIINQAVESVSGMARKWEKTLILDIAPDLPAVMGRQDDLVRVLINLLENAIHYSREAGEIRLSAQVTDDDNILKTPAIRISVVDDGDGIEASEIPKLTQRFYRVDKSRSRDMGGTGLGLAIVKHILVRHRGKLAITSAPGKGSDFTIYLPVRT